MEWLVLVLFAALAALLIGFPLQRTPAGMALEAPALDTLREERARLLSDLRELDDDAASGRISAAERLSGRRALAPRLRALTEALRAEGDDMRAPA